MKTDIHPEYNEIDVTCSCGNTFKTRSTRSEALTLDVCSECHPFYTGKQQVTQAEGRVANFNRRFGHLSKKGDA